MSDRSTIHPAPVSEADFDCEPIPFPDTKSPTFARELSAYVRKILLATPSFPRIYTETILHYAPNSRAAKILRPHYTKILEKVNMALKQQEQHKSSRSCTHIKVTGVRCGSPSLRGEQFCYFHQRMHRGVRTPPQTRLHPIACLEDEESIQAALMEVVNALMRNTIDLKRATLILRALHIAVKNASHVRFEFHGNKSIHEIPAYNAAPDPAEPTEIDLPATAAIAGQPHREPSGATLNREQLRAARIDADQRRYEAKMQAAIDRQADIRARLERTAKYHSSTTHATPAAPAPPPPTAPTPTIHPDGTAHIIAPPSHVATAASGHVATATSGHVGTAAPGCPPSTNASIAKPEAASPKPDPANSKKKPPMPVKEATSPLAADAAAPKGRKNAAHGASRG